MKERVTHLNGLSFIVEIYGTEEQDTAYQGLATQTILVSFSYMRNMRHQTESLLLRLPAHFLFLPTSPQDDIQIIINQQLRSQQQSELSQKKSTTKGMSFFRKPSRTASTWTSQCSSSSPSPNWSSDADQDKTQSPWRDWLRRGKGAQYGK